MAQNPLEAMIAQALQGAQKPMTEMPAAEPSQQNAAQPVIGQDQLRQLLSQAIAPQPNALPQAKSAALMRLGAGLMQAPKAGQSVGGMVGNAVSGFTDEMAKAKQAEQAANIQRAEMGMKIAGFEAQQQQADLSRKKGALELRDMQLKSQYLPQQMQADYLKDLAVAQHHLQSGNAAAAAAALNNAKLKYADQLGQAEVNLINARIRETDAAAGANKALQSQREMQIGHEKLKVTPTPLGDGSVAYIESSSATGARRAWVVKPADQMTITTQIANEVKMGLLKTEEEKQRRYGELMAGTVTPFSVPDTNSPSMAVVPGTTAPQTTSANPQRKIITTKDLEAQLGGQEGPTRPIRY